MVGGCCALSKHECHLPTSLKGWKVACTISQCCSARPRPNPVSTLQRLPERPQLKLERPLGRVCDTSRIRRRHPQGAAFGNAAVGPEGWEATKKVAMLATRRRSGGAMAVPP